MPLILNPGLIEINHTTHSGITEGEWFRLKAVLNGRQYFELKANRAVSLSVPRDSIGKPVDDSKLDIVTNIDALNMKRLATFIESWVFKEYPINEDTVALLDARTMSILLEVIKGLMDNQEPIGDNDPLERELDSI